MVKLFLFLSFSFVIPCSASMRSAQLAGKEWGKNGFSFALDQGKKIDIQELTTTDSKNQSFDAKDAKRKIDNQLTPESETLDFLTSPQVQNNQRRKCFHEEEFFIKNSEEIFAAKSKKPVSQVEKELGYTLHTCQKSGDPFLVSTKRTLNVQVNLEPKELVKVCLGHKKNVFVKKIGDFKESTRKLVTKYKRNPTIQPESVQIICLQAHSPNYYVAQISYSHLDNAEGCDKCCTKTIKNKLRNEVFSEWIYDNQELWNLSKSPDCTVIEHICLDGTPTKMINGQSINRQCWQEKISFLYQFPSTNDCNVLKQKNCEQIKQECLQSNFSSCVQWQLTFRCLDRINQTYQAKEFRIETDEEPFSYSPNQSFSEVTAKLAVFAEVKKEMEQSNEFDVTKLEIFKGKKMSCSKNVADHLMYDCCFSYAGLAKQMGLSKCNADEIGLAEMREQGLCHYVGSYEEKMLNLWTSRDEHVFCCFPTKLSRIVQEEGRKQIGRGWGEAEEPNCRGFTTDELSRLNFSKMDLSEICDDFVKKLPDDMPERLQNFQNRLQQEIDQVEIKQ